LFTELEQSVCAYSTYPGSAAHYIKTRQALKRETEISMPYPHTCVVAGAHRSAGLLTIAALITMASFVLL
jgi:hypothetical protein